MDEEDEKTSEKRYTDEETGKFIEGNPGRPKGSKNYLTLLQEALEEEAKKAGKTYWQKLAEWCFTNPGMAASILKKFIPDREHKEVEYPEPIRGVFEVINGNNKSNGNIPMADREQGEG